MKTSVLITMDVLRPRGVAAAGAGCGAVVEFAGVVRGEEDGVVISALDYEAYEPMASRQIERILTELEPAHSCVAVEVSHRIGRVPVGEAAILVRIEAKHRGEAFQMLEKFMIRLKQDVPIWKRVP
jgi:molybdopterin synthase catalytic subunit